MSHRDFQNINNRAPPPGSLSGALTIQDIINIYGFLNNITNPTEKIIEAKGNLENIILAFSRSLGAGPPQ